MKKIFSFVMAGLISLLSTSVWAETVSKEEAVQLAGSFLSAKVQSGTTTADVRRAPALSSAIDDKELTMKQVKSLDASSIQKHGRAAVKAASHSNDQLTLASERLEPNFKALDLPKALNFDQFYVIQEDDADGGWVIMAADDAVQPVLAYGLTGTFDPDPNHMPENLKWWLGMYNSQIKSAVASKLTASEEVKAEWDALRNGVRKAKQATVVGPLITTKWDQGSPYNGQCPSSRYTGCVATAMAQVMNYYEWPNQGQGSHSYYDSDSKTNHSVNFANTTYEWANMPEPKGTNNSTQAQRNAVATLMYHCGVAVEMGYGEDGSGAQTLPLRYGNTTSACAMNALWNYFKYNADSLQAIVRSATGTSYTGYNTSNWTETNWKNMLKAELDKKRPILYSGFGGGAGHSFICDGYDSNDYFHFNWGWSGMYDNYFTVNSLNPGTGGAGSGEGTYNQGQGVIIGIVPNVSSRYTITYNAGEHATCATATQSQNTVGQSFILPNISSVEDKWLFLGWSDREGSQVPNVGKPGDSYTPMRNLTLYAVVVPDGYVLRFISKINLADEVTELAGLTGAPYYWSDLLDEIPSWNGHGTCDVDSLRETEKGAGIVLPTASADGGFTFQQWLYLADNGQLYVAGYPGDRVYPASDMNLYGYWTDDSKIWLDYYLTGAVRVSGPEDGWITQADGFTATFTAEDFFEPLAAGNTTVTVKVDGETLDASKYTKSFNAGVLTLTISADKLLGDVEVYITATDDYTACANYSFTFSNNNQYLGTGNKTLGAWTWTVEATGNTTCSYQNGAGARFGATTGNNRQCTSLTYTTTSASGCLIKTITIGARAGVSGTIQAFINDVPLGDAQNLTTTNATYTFTNSDKLHGTVKFVVTNTATTGNNRYYLYVRTINATMYESVTPAAPIQVTVDYLTAEYYDYNEGEGDPDYDWSFIFWPTNGQYADFTQYRYPIIMVGIDAAPSMTTLSGSHDPYQVVNILAITNGQISSYKAAVSVEEPFTFTYVRTRTVNGTTYYVYHVTAKWTTSDGEQYYIDSDVYAEISDPDGNPVTPSGDTDARYYRTDFYQQNVNGNGYTLFESVTGQGESGATIEVTRNYYTGFLTPAAQSVTLANNNTQANPAVVEYYYDRRRFPVTFMANNIPVQRDTLRYMDTPAYRGADPVHESNTDFVYVFAGWSPLITTVKQAATYTAQFNATACYTVSFDVNGIGTAPESQRVYDGQKATRPANPSAEGYDFVDWYTDQTYQTVWNFNTAITATRTLYAKWNAHTHNIAWNADGGVLSGSYTSGSVAYGTAISAPTATRQGYTFAGWDNAVPATMPDEDLSFTAQWTPNTNTAYKVLHNQQNIADDNYTLFETENLTGTTAASVTPARKNYTGFIAPEAQTASIAADGSLIISYNYARNKYPLSWDTDGGTISGSGYTAAGQVKFGAPLSAPVNVTKAGYDFAGWSPAVPATMPAQSQSFTAQWNIKTYSGISFTSEDENKGTVSVTGQKATYNYGDQVTITASPKPGYSFTGWSDDNATASRTLRIGIDISSSLVARFAANSNTPYIVHHFQQNILDDEYTEILPVDNLTGTTNTLTNVAPAVKNYTGFDVQPYENVLIKGDGSTEVNIYYNRKTFVIRFLVDGAVKQSETLRYGATPVYKLATPTKAEDAQYSYTFNGWDPAIALVSATQDYNAKWTNNLKSYQISFNANGHGVAPAPQNIAYGSKVSEPAALTETGYTFGGWYKEAACQNAWNFANDIVTGAQELFAKWTINTHRISWDANGGELSGSYTSGNDIAFGSAITAPNVSRVGYHFEGWNPSVPATMPDDDLDFVAQWAANTNTPYVVKHLQQNILDNEYTEVLADRQNLTGTTGASVTPAVKNYVGFTAPATQTANIAADGSLIIEYRYLRNSYDLAWDANGGDALTGNYTSGLVKFGAQIVAPNTPTRTGWDFDGWNPNVPETMPAQALSLKATWSKSGDTPYKVEHYFQLLDGSYPATADETENKKGETDSEVTPAVKSVEGFTAPAPQTASILANGSLVIVYKYARNQHRLSWDANGGELSGAYTSGDAIFFGAEINAPVAARIGYTFAGWNNNVPATMPDNDLDFMAQWNANSNTAYRVEHRKQNLNDDNFTLFEAEDLTGATGASVSPIVKNYEGFTAPVAQTADIAADGSLVIIYNYTRNSYNLIWNANGGQLADNGYTHGSVKFETPILAPADPVYAGHEFHGWDKAIPASMPAGDLTLNAQWTTNSYGGITFTSNNEIAGSVSVDPEQASYNFGDVVEISATANEGYTFTGWSDGSDQADRTIIIDENTTSLIANFIANTNTPYVVKHFKQNLENDEFTEDLANRQNLEGTTGELIQIAPLTYEGFLTPGSQTGQVAIAGDGSTVIEYYYTRNSYNIEWIANGGELSGEYSQGLLKYEAPIAAPAISRLGYNFLGWGADIPATMPAHALSFAAQWEAESYSNISFLSEDEQMGTVTVDPDKNEYNFGENVTISAEANDGYTFEGWSDENGNIISTDATTVITIDENTGAITAIFSANTDTRYIVRRFLQNIDDDNFTQWGEDIELFGTTGAEVSPAVEEIDGFTAPELQTVAIAGDGSTVIIYNYTRNSYDLSWDANGGQLLDNGRTEGSVRFGKPIIPAEAAWQGHIFLGWLPAEIPATMPAQALNFVAQWEAETVEGLVFASSDENAGSITVLPEKEVYEVGDVVTVTAEANEGYSFSGWSDGNTDGAERVITIDENTPDSIVAIFTPNEGAYILRIFLQNIEDDEFVLDSEQEIISKTGDLVEPIAIEGFTAPEAQPVVIILDSVNIIEFRYIRNSYNLVWNVEDAVLSGEYTSGLVKFGAEIIAPADPVREGFTFIGWDAEIPATMPAADLTINALWEESQGIEIVVDGKTILCNEEIRIYDYNGRDVTGLNGNLGNGMYIIVGGGSATKVAIY